MAVPIIAAAGKLVGGAVKLFGGKGGGKGGAGGGEGGQKGGIIKNALGKGAGGIQAVLGAGQAIAGMIKQKKADAMLPSAEDAGQRQMRNYFARQKTALDSGTAGASQRNALQQMMQSGVKEAFKYGAGARGLNQMSQMYQQGIQGLNEQDRASSLAYAQEEGKLVDSMAQRRLDLGMQRYDREQARAASLKTKGNQNLAAGAGSLMGGASPSVGGAGGGEVLNNAVSKGKGGVGKTGGLPNPFKK
jgi:hypothetical protein